MSVRMPQTRYQEKKMIFSLSDDFGHWIDNDKWVAEADDGSADGDVVEVAAAVHGVVELPTDPILDDQTYLRSKQEHYLFAARKPLFFEWLGYYGNEGVSHVVDEENMFIGMMNALAVATPPMQPAGAGPKADANFSGFGFFKTSTDLVWSTVVSNSADAAFPQRTQELLATNANNLTKVKQDCDLDTLYRLRAEARPIALVSALILEMEFVFWIDDVLVVRERGYMTIANFTEMHFGFGISNGTATAANVEVSMFVDWVDSSQMRIDVI